MKHSFKLISGIACILSLLISNAYSAGDAEQIKALSSFKKTGLDVKGEVIPQDTKYAANIKKNILPNIKLPRI